MIPFKIVFVLFFLVIIGIDVLLFNFKWFFLTEIPTRKKLVGGFTYFLFSSLIWGNDPIWRAYFFEMGWNSTSKQLEIGLNVDDLPWPVNLPPCKVPPWEIKP